MGDYNHEKLRQQYDEASAYLEAAREKYNAAVRTALDELDLDKKKQLHYVVSSARAELDNAATGENEAYLKCMGARLGKLP
ncbi:hypothetical protein [Sorangium sp. So ce426]|uniref:hypothetical protein n=1 Tax=Sorangium sp. So ce426 TaxID=3133312 RepID=UPI003F5AF45F